MGRGQRSEFRGQGKAPKGWKEGRYGGRGGRGEGGRGTLRSASAATEQPNSFSAAGRRRSRVNSRGQEVREFRESPEVVFPRYGKFIFDFSMLWKNNFHGVENLGRYGARGADFFHGVEKMFPQCGKVLWGDGAAGGGRWGVAGGVGGAGGAGAGAPVEEGEAGEE